VSKPKHRAKPELQSVEIWLIRACLIVALGISFFLAWSSLQGGGVPGCGPDSECDKVLSSRWAYIFGLPISFLAMPVYAGLLALTRPRNVAWRWVVPLAAVVLVSALWFVSVQAFALRAFCKFCMGAHVAGVLAALILLKNTPQMNFAPIAAGAAAAGLLIAGQFLTPERAPKQFVHATSPALPATVTNSAAVGTSSATASAVARGPVEATTAAPHPTMTIIDGEFTLDLTKVPVTGPLSAPKKVAKLFDYTCHHCRDLHHLLAEFRTAHSNELAVVSLPMPLDAQCNSLLRRTQESHQNACEYARYGLAVFHAQAEKFEAYTHFIFEPARPPALSKARQFAVDLVGRESFEQSLRNPGIVERIRTDIEIYKAVHRKTRSGQLPQMYFEAGASVGAVRNREQLEEIMAQNLGFPVPAK
jgi:uncharacterized membrane protein